MATTQTTRKTSNTDKHVHLVPHDKGWAVKRTGNDRPSKVFEKKPDAMEQAIRVARRDNTVLVVHRQDGSVQSQRNYSG